MGELIVVENPRCSGDFFTDRWPENHHGQDLLIDDMKLFLRQLEVVLDESRSLKDRTAALEAMFGETIARDVVKDFAEEAGGLVRSGKHALGAAGGILAAPASAKAKPAGKDEHLLRLQASPPLPDRAYRNVALGPDQGYGPQMAPVSGHARHGASVTGLVRRSEGAGTQLPHQCRIRAASSGRHSHVPVHARRPGAAPFAGSQLR